MARSRALARRLEPLTSRPSFEMPAIAMANREITITAITAHHRPRLAALILPLSGRLSYELYARYDASCLSLRNPASRQLASNSFAGAVMNSLIGSLAAVYSQLTVRSSLLALSIATVSTPRRRRRMAAFAVIYERLGTKGLLLHDARIVRELDRSFYHANAYEYSVALFNDLDGRVLLAHCPGEYCRIELEEAETGRPLTASADRKPSDFFHSRLATSPHGRRLLSAGWLWHPLSVVAWFDIGQALADPHHLDSGDALPRLFNPGLAEESSACWLDEDRIAVAV
jgi:hypothetical protein